MDRHLSVISRRWPHDEVPGRLSDRTRRANAGDRAGRPASRPSSSSKADRWRGAFTRPGIDVTAGDLNRTDTYLKADLSPTTCVIVEDNHRPGAQEDARGHQRRRARRSIYVLGLGEDAGSARRRIAEPPFRSVFYLTMSELFGGPLVTQISRSLTRARVQQYQRYFADADRVLILLHNDPDPDAMASGLALRNILRRTKATAILGTLQGVTRPENLRMANLLDIQVESVTPASLGEFERIAMVDVQPHYFGELLNRVDLVDRPSPAAAGLQRRLQGHPGRLRIRPRRSSPSICARST